jgi:predicted Fe-Mo cluster-binding NifX family protein
MRIAVAASEESEDADVSSRAARAPYYFIYDTGDRAVEVIANPFDKHERGMGLRVADFLASKGVGLVIAQRFGTAFAAALESKGLRPKAMRGRVRAAAERAYAGMEPGTRKRGKAGDLA